MEPSKRRFILRKRSKRNASSAKCMRKRLKRLKVEMEEISKEQQSIREGQSEVRAKFNAIEEECQQLRNETNQIIQQTANTQLRLGLMFSILKAREQGDLVQASQLTQLLREIVGRDNRGEPNLSRKQWSNGVQTDLQGQTCCD